MKFNLLDYKLILKGIDLNSPLVDEMVDKKLFFVDDLSEAFETLYPDKDIPDNIKTLYYKSNQLNILNYIRRFIFNKQKKPDSWAFHCFFDRTNQKKYSQYYEREISENILELIEVSIMYLGFDQIDSRFFNFLNRISFFNLLMTIKNKKIKFTDSENFRKLLSIPEKYNKFDMFKLLEDVFETRFKFDNESVVTLYKILNDIGVLDKWLEIAIELGIGNSLIDSFLSYGYGLEELPNKLKNMNQNSLGFKSFFNR